MSEMIERVAAAMEARAAALGPVTMEDVARAAIKAMREPTDSMLAKAPNLMSSLAKKDWQAMIDAALGDQGEGEE